MICDEIKGKSIMQWKYEILLTAISKFSRHLNAHLMNFIHVCFKKIHCVQSKIQSKLQSKLTFF